MGRVVARAGVGRGVSVQGVRCHHTWDRDLQGALPSLPKRPVSSTGAQGSPAPKTQELANSAPPGLHAGQTLRRRCFFPVSLEVGPEGRGPQATGPGPQMPSVLSPFVQWQMPFHGWKRQPHQGDRSCPPCLHGNAALLSQGLPASFSACIFSAPSLTPAQTQSLRWGSCQPPGFFRTQGGGPPAVAVVKL